MRGSTTRRLPAEGNRSIRLSPAHGVNPSLLLCPVCGEAGGVALLGKLPGRFTDHDPEAPRKLLDPGGPCKQCAGELERARRLGVVVLVVADEWSPDDEPKRSPWCFFVSWSVVKREAWARLELGDRFVSAPVVWMAESAAERLGLKAVPPCFSSIEAAEEAASCDDPDAHGPGCRCDGGEPVL